MKICCFAGHRDKWHCNKIEEKLEQRIEELINEGYDVFYDGGYGAFDKKCRNVVLRLKSKYPHIKLVKILAYYNHDKSKYYLPRYYDSSIFPEIGEFHFKQRIAKRNEWMAETADAVICHIEYKCNSGAYRMVKHAGKRKKRIIYI